MIGWPSYLDEPSTAYDRCAQAPFNRTLAMQGRVHAPCATRHDPPTAALASPCFMSVSIACASIDRVLVDLYETFLRGARCFFLFFAFAFSDVRRQNP